jgi:pSer/pThr/pTyr-binding forkhead associated (FHA) protein
MCRGDFGDPAVIQLQILSGKASGTAANLRRFPAFVGRGASSDLRLEEAGVWERHLEIHLDGRRGFFVKTHSEGIAFLNGTRIEEEALRNGDLIEFGSAKLQFWLGEMPQRSFRLRECCTWAGLAILSAGQLGLIYWLLQN